jgi:F0F1-type ATP synthase membrane subunit a
LVITTSEGGLVVPSNYQVCAEMLYTFITSLVREQLGQANGAKYISIVFTVFLYILTANLLGLIPFSFATGSTCCCFWLSFSLFIGVTLIGIMGHKLHF